MTPHARMRSVSVVVVVHHRDPLLRRCLESLLASRDVAVELAVVCNGDADAAGDVPADARVRVLHTPNRGFAAACHEGARATTGDVLAFVNPDAVADPDALAALAAALDDPEIGIATATVRLLRDPQRLNALGVQVHFLGLGWARHCGEPADAPRPVEAVIGPSGAAMALRRSVWTALGGLTEEFFLYHEDAELGVRCWLAGLRVVCLPGAQVFHDYEFTRHPGKLYFLERNRLIVVLCCYAARTLLLLLPALLAYEMGMVAVAAAQGWLPDKCRGWGWLVRHARWLREHRRAVQRSRRRPDRALVPLLAARFQTLEMPLPRVLAVADRALATYWRLVSRLV